MSRRLGRSVIDTPRSKTIQIHLKDSDPNGVKIAELSVSKVKVYVIPRQQVSFANTRQDLERPTVYMLFDDERTTVYIGECENFVKRIKQHHADTGFWQWALAVTATDESLDKADVKFLESKIVQKAMSANRMEMMNKTSPAQNQLHEFKEETLLEFFDHVELLIASLGFNVLEPLKEPVSKQAPKTRRAQRQSQIKTPSEREYDTIVCPARPEAIDEVFRKEKSWYAVRIGQANRTRLKYVSLYERAPISRIRYYAKITKIEPYLGHPSKYKIYHDGNVIELAKHIGLGKSPNLAPQSSRYFKLEDMKSSTTLQQLIDKAFS